MNDLPAELLTKVFLLLPLKQVLSCQLVCRRWWDLIRDSMQIWGRFTSSLTSEGGRLQLEYERLVPIHRRLDPFLLKPVVLRLSSQLDALESNWRSQAFTVVSRPFPTLIEFKADFERGIVLVLIADPDNVGGGFLVVSDLRDLKERWRTALKDVRSAQLLGSTSSKVVVRLGDDCQVWDGSGETLTSFRFATEVEMETVCFCGDALACRVAGNKAIRMWNLGCDHRKNDVSVENGIRHKIRDWSHCGRLVHILQDTRVGAQSENERLRGDSLEILLTFCTTTGCKVARVVLADVVVGDPYTCGFYHKLSGRFLVRFYDRDSEFIHFTDLDRSEGLNFQPCSCLLVPMSIGMSDTDPGK